MILEKSTYLEFFIDILIGLFDSGASNWVKNREGSTRRKSSANLKVTSGRNKKKSREVRNLKNYT
jgi:hypothetical protein